MVEVDWPETAVPLFLPQEWQSPKNRPSVPGDPPKCVYKYDEKENLLKLVSLDDPEVVIDILDPDDVINVAVEINMTNDMDPRVTTTNTTTDDKEDTGRPSNAPPTDTLSDTKGHAVLTIYSYPREDPNNPPDKGSSILRWCGMGKINPKPRPTYQRPGEQEWEKWGHRYAFHRRFTVVPSEDVGPLNQLVKAMRQAAQLLQDRGRALVVVNPFAGGQRKAEGLYHDIVSVVLEQANVEHDLVVTKYALHAKERMMKGGGKDDQEDDGRDLAEYTALIPVGGDGIVFECLQGIKARDDALEILQKLNVGIIGAGTSNGMAKSIAVTSHQQSSVLDASFLVAKGCTRPTDLSEYWTANQSYWSFLTFSWAMMASIDIDSECLRALGTFRFDLWGAWCVVGMKSYKAKFSYLPPDKDDNKSDPTLPAMTEELPASKWVTEEDDFLLLWTSHVAYGGEKVYHCPPSRLDDEVFHILVIRKKNTSRLAMAQMLIGIEDGSHVKFPQAEFIPCTAFRLEPATPSINDIDGEVVESGPVQAKVMPGAMKVFCK
ncbi:Sphingosine kinase 1 [Seminavis robusta]|uniref:Sphingosine kinase 1 n=1 Tax=Seminavis robusta TaxID=568900 RepID=A0A9N8DRW3_9STRA|nr:Sphingosine kinase 1 [Seminavis robusta]|eukprot:Sro244_g097250.1 Sphingosine kinase 1 (547) ;mRNA; f:64193-65904